MGGSLRATAARRRAGSGRPVHRAIAADAPRDGRDPKHRGLQRLSRDNRGKRDRKGTCRAYHPRSVAAPSGPYLGINCAAIPENLLESELFGHERGAFTGADRRHEGCFEQANGGTLLLDEISETRPDIQAKLLRVIEERKLRRVGGSGEIALDVRIIAASNQDLSQAVRDGRFREDLYYRLNVLSVSMPPLRERADDIPLLVNSFVQHFTEGGGKRIVGVDEACLAALMAHQWPGNIRQLRNVIERAVIYAKGPFITMVELPPDFQNITAPGGACPAHFQVSLGSSAEQVERELILRTLEFVKGNKTLAAKVLKFSPKTLYNKLARYAT